jgi:hypothetical protein
MSVDFSVRGGRGLQPAFFFPRTYQVAEVNSTPPDGESTMPKFIKINAKFDSKCRCCGKPIVVGEPVEWDASKEVKGVRCWNIKECNTAMAQQAEEATETARERAQVINEFGNEEAYAKVQSEYFTVPMGADEDRFGF